MFSGHRDLNTDCFIKCVSGPLGQNAPGPRPWSLGCTWTGSRRSSLPLGLLPCAPGGAESRREQRAVSCRTAGFARGGPCFRQRWPGSARVLACPSSPSPEWAVGGRRGRARHREPVVPPALPTLTPGPSGLVEAAACFGFRIRHLLVAVGATCSPCVGGAQRLWGTH